MNESDTMYRELESPFESRRGFVAWGYARVVAITDAYSEGSVAHCYALQSEA